MRKPRVGCACILGRGCKMDLKALHEAVTAALALAGSTRVMTRVENLNLKGSYMGSNEAGLVSCPRHV